MAFNYYRTVTIDYTKCGTANSTDFPFLFYGTYSWLATVANGGSVQNSSGYDIAFFSNSSLTTQLKHELISYTATTGAVEIWVKIPSLSYTSNTIIYIAYGNSGISTDQSDAANVWDSNHKGVWHLTESPSGTLYDSTSNNNDLTSSGSMDSSDLVSAKFGNGLIFNGSNQYLSIADNDSLSITGALTLSCWMNMPNNPASANEGVIAKYRNMTGYSNQRSYELTITPNGYPYAVISSNGTFTSGNYSEVTYVGDRADGNWHLFHVVFNPSTSLSIYIDGGAYSATNTTSIVSSCYNGTAPFAIAHQLDTANANYYANATIDEVRVSSTNRSTSWILSEYNNQNSPSTFYSLGDAVSNTTRRIIIIS